MDKNIDLKNIIKSSYWENKTLFFSIITLIGGYWLENVLFPRAFSKFTANVPDFISTMNFGKVINILAPYLAGHFLIFMNNMINSHKFPKIELSIVRKITEQTLESIKTSKKTININEFIMNLKKIIDSKVLYQLLISYIIPTILVGIGLIYYFFKASMNSGLIALVIITLFIIITYFIEQASITKAQKNEDAINEYYDTIQDIIINSETIITSGEEDKEIKNVKKSQDNVYKTYKDVEVEISKTTLKLHLVNIVVILTLIGLGICEFKNNNMNTELLIAICFLSIDFMSFYNSTIHKLKHSVGYIGKFKELDKYFSSFNIIDRPLTSFNNKTIEGTIKLTNFGVKYGDRQIINNYNLIIPANKKIGIIGQIGKGKTSIIKAIAGLINYTGNIYIDSYDIKTYDYNDIMRYIGYIPQHPKLFNKTIYYNINYGSKYSKKEVYNKIKEFGFEKFIKQFTDKLDTNVGKEGAKLSGGQKQIIAILRALIQNKKILLLDEPTSSLDEDTKNQIISLLNKLKNKTIIIVSHDSDLDHIYDDIIELH